MLEEPSIVPPFAKIPVVLIKIQGNELIFEKALETVRNAHDLNAIFLDGGLDDRADGGVEAGAIAPAG